jgi:hypothetical protein
MKIPMPVNFYQVSVPIKILLSQFQEDKPEPSDSSCTFSTDEGVWGGNLSSADDGADCATLRHRYTATLD